MSNATTQSPQDRPRAPAGELTRSATETWLSGQTGVQIARTSDGRLAWSLPPGLAAQVHMLTPTTQIVQVDRNYLPVPKLVSLDQDEHAYKEPSDQDGGFALTAKALSLLADAAGIEFLEPHIDYMGGRGVSYTSRARRRGPDGVMQENAKTKAVRFAVEERKWRREREATMTRWRSRPSDEEWALLLEKFVDDRMTHIDATVETKAMARVVRHWLAVKSTYPRQEITAKPFLVFAWVFTPDYENPHVAQLLEANYGGARARLYAGGGEPLGREDEDEVLDAEPVDAEPVEEPQEPDEPQPAPAPAPPAAPVIDMSLTDIPWDPAEFAPKTAPAVPQGPPMPEENPTLTAGPHTGRTMRELVEDDQGRIWLLERGPQLQSMARDLVLAWLSWGERRPVTAEDCPAIAHDLKLGMGL